MIREHRRSFRVIRQVLDALMVLGAWYAFLYISTHGFNPLQLPVHWNDEYLRLGGFLAVSWAAALVLGGAYGNTRQSGFGRALYLGIRVVALNITLFSIAVFVFKFQFLSRRFFFVYHLIAFSLLVSSRLSETALLAALRRMGFNTLSAVVVGGGKNLEAVLAQLKAHEEWGYRVVGVLGGATEARRLGFRALGPVSRLDQVLKNHVVDLIVLARDKRVNLNKILLSAAPAGVSIFEAIPEDLAPWGPELDQLGELRALHYNVQRRHPYGMMAKGVLDVVAAALLLVLLSPVFLLISLGVLLSSGRPVFYVQKRLGRNGRAFWLYKFRSMVVDAREQQEQLKGANVMGGPVFKVKDDPRVTSFGKFLRKTTLDELPQLLNVARGEMSLVGPRPLPSSEARKIPLWALRRGSVKPGLTCTWQISGRNKIGFDEWMRMDLKYIDDWSLWLDLKILLKTLPAVLSSRGAY